MVEDDKFNKFMAILKKLLVNIALVEALEQIPGYAKFMKVLFTKKGMVSYELVYNVRHCSTIAIRLLV